jgi:hypothetical protein
VKRSLFVYLPLKKIIIYEINPSGLKKILQEKKP